MAKYKAPGVVTRYVGSTSKPAKIGIYYLSVETPLFDSIFSSTDSLTISGKTNAPAGLKITATIDSIKYESTIEMGGDWEIEIPSLSGFSSGVQTVQVEIIDDSFKTIMVEFNITIDSVNPVVSINGGSDIFTSSSTPTIDGTVIDDNINTLTVEVSDGVSVVYATTLERDYLTSSDWSVTSTSLSDGEYIVTAVAEDLVDNSNVANQTLTVDTLKPTQPTNLTEGTTTTNSTSFSWTSSSDLGGVTNYNIYKDGILVATTVTTNYTLIGLDSATEYSIEVSAVDIVGNESDLSTALSVTTS